MKDLFTQPINSFEFSSQHWLIKLQLIKSLVKIEDRTAYMQTNS